MLHDLIYWFGLGCATLFAMVLALLVWVFLIWPAVEAASITRMTFEVYKRRGIT